MIEKRVAELWDYLVERQQIYHRRFVEKRPWPWTLDPTFRKWQFPNVYRELDRGTIYLREELLPQLEPHDVLLNLVAYRHFNTIWAARCLLPIKSSLPQHIELYLHGQDPYTQAYRTSPFMEMGGLSQLENSQIASYTWEANCRRDLAGYSMTEVMYFLRSLPGVGPFVAYVICCDLTYTDLVDFTEDSDVFPHTGSIAALEYMLDGPMIMPRHHGKLLIRELQERHYLELRERGFKFLQQDEQNQRLSLRGIEDGLCELMRYKRHQAGSTIGRRYFPHTMIPA